MHDSKASSQNGFQIRASHQLYELVQNIQLRLFSNFAKISLFLKWNTGIASEPFLYKTFDWLQNKATVLSAPACDFPTASPALWRGCVLASGRHESQGDFCQQCSFCLKWNVLTTLPFRWFPFVSMRGLFSCVPDGRAARSRLTSSLQPNDPNGAESELLPAWSQVQLSTTL